MEGLVSVIIPTYNRANYLNLALKSVLGQTYKNIEVIVIDDGSTDQTAKVVEAFNDRRLKYFRQSNKGIPAAVRNIGLQKSKGEYIAFLDDDDLWCSDKIQCQVRYLELHPEYDIVYSNAIIIDENGNKKGILLKHSETKAGRIFPDILDINFIPILTVLMKRKVLESNGFLNEKRFMVAVEDYEYWIRASLRFNFGYIDRPLARYRIHSTSISKASSKALSRQKVLIHFLNNSDVSEKVHKKLIYNIERLNFSASVYYWSISDKLNARIHIKRYILFNLKKGHLIKSILGILLFIMINFKYDLFIKIIHSYENNIAGII